MPSDNNYGLWSRAIHHMALAHPNVAEASFDIERATHKPHSDDIVNQPHVFVTGLARAGTTILMRQLHLTGAYRSLTYRDMPFVLAPNSWSRISRLSNKNMEAKERAHGDNILIDFDSPEAFEEVFWRVMCGDDYIRKDRLVPMSTDPDIEKDFCDYVSLVLLQHPGKHYLSKNNNNILRLPSLHRCFPAAAIVIPFRDPVQQAYSLARQHSNFIAQHAATPFSQRYMTWLVHHEFGLDHRPFVFDDGAFARVEKHPSPTHGLDYWLQRWIEAYRFIAETAPRQCIFLSYERLCDDQAVWPHLCTKLGLPDKAPGEPFRASRQTVNPDVPDALLKEAQTLHQALLERAI